MIEEVTHNESWRLVITQEPHEKPWPDMPVPHSRAHGSMFRPDTIRVELSAGSESVYVAGQRVKKDGTTGRQSAHTGLYQALPAWVEETVEQVRRRHNLGEGTVNRKSEWDTQ